MSAEVEASPSEVSDQTDQQKTSLETKVTPMPSQIHAPIGKIELVACGAFLTCVLGLGFRSLYKAANDTSEEIHVNHWAEADKAGRIIKSHYQDIADLEWQGFETQWKYTVAFGLLNAASSWLLANFNLHAWRQVASIPIGLLFLLTSIGIQNSSLFVAEAFIVYALMRLSRFPIVLGWLFGIFHIMLPHLQFFINDGPVYGGHQFAQIFAIWGWMWNVMRYVSFGSEWQWAISKDEALKRDKKDDSTPSQGYLDCSKPALSFTFVDFLSYTFYMPCLFGSIITYRHYNDHVIAPFRKIGNNEYQANRSFKADVFLRQLAIVCFWLLVTLLWGELFMHYSTQQLPHVIQELDGFGAGIAPWAHGQYFQAKYMCIYGVAWLMAHLDHGVELTPLPIFISRVYLYSNMWKYFDTGLYDFLKSYLYIPIGKMAGRHWAGAVTFLFIWAWHGTTKTMALWTVCNFFQIVVEGVIRHACNNEKSWIYRNIRAKVTPSWWRRFEALACAASFAFSLFAIAFFLMGSDIAKLVVSKTYSPITINFWMVIATSYAWIQTVFSWENWNIGCKL